MLCLFCTQAKESCLHSALSRAVVGEYLSSYLNPLSRALCQHSHSTLHTSLTPNQLQCRVCNEACFHFNAAMSSTPARQQPCCIKGVHSGRNSGLHVLIENRVQVSTPLIAFLANPSFCLSNSVYKRQYRRCIRTRHNWLVGV